MSFTDYIIFSIVLISGIYLFRRARSLAFTQRSRLESKAIERLNRYFSQLDSDIREYTVYTKPVNTSDDWKQVSLETMKSDVLKDCEVRKADTFYFQKARFSVRSDPEKKELYYVAGDDNARFDRLQ